MKILPFSKTYELRRVLDFPGMEVRPGNIYAIIGANGSGKSTFAKILSGILTADKKGALQRAAPLAICPRRIMPSA